MRYKKNETDSMVYPEFLIQTRFLLVPTQILKVGLRIQHQLKTTIWIQDNADRRALKYYFFFKCKLPPHYLEPRYNLTALKEADIPIQPTAQDAYLSSFQYVVVIILSETSKHGYGSGSEFLPDPKTGFNPTF